MTIVAVGVGVAAAGTLAGVATSVQANRNARKLGNRQADLATQQEQFAEDQINQGQPLRELGNNQLESFMTWGALPRAVSSPPPETFGLDNFMRTGELPTALDLAPTTAANRDILESQFANARGQAAASLPAGGQLNAALTNLEGQRALGVTQLYSNENQQKNQLAQSLFGVGLDFSKDQAAHDADLRRQLFAAALGIPNQQGQLALGGMSGASNSLLGSASTALGAGKQLQGQLSDIAGTGAAVARNQQLMDLLGKVYGGNTGMPQGVPYYDKSQIQSSGSTPNIGY